MSTDGRPLVVAVVGPTATGKSDSGCVGRAARGRGRRGRRQQLYRGMDIGTAKLPVEERRGIAHHQLDVLDVTRRRASPRTSGTPGPTSRGVLARGRTPVVVGGSGLYVRAAARPPRHPADRPRRPRRRSRSGPRSSAPARLRRARERDPEAAAAVEPNNRRRIVRALEVIELDRIPVLRDAAAARVRPPHAGAGPPADPVELDAPHRATGAPHVGRGARRRGARPGGARHPAWAHREHGDRLRPGARPARRRPRRHDGPRPRPSPRRAASRGGRSRGSAPTRARRGSIPLRPGCRGRRGARGGRRSTPQWPAWLSG